MILTSSTFFSVSDPIARMTVCLCFLQNILMFNPFCDSVYSTVYVTVDVYDLTYLNKLMNHIHEFNQINKIKHNDCC